MTGQSTTAVKAATNERKRHTWSGRAFPTIRLNAICRKRKGEFDPQTVINWKFTAWWSMMSYHTLLFFSNFWIFYAIESINQSINQSKYDEVWWAITLCYFPVTSGFSMLLNQSINQSIKVWWSMMSYHTLLFSSDFWIFYVTESINQSINQSKCDEAWRKYKSKYVPL